MSDNITVELNVRDRGTAVVKRFASQSQELFQKMSGQGVSAVKRLSSGLSSLADRMRRSGQETR